MKSEIRNPKSENRTGGSYACPRLLNLLLPVLLALAACVTPPSHELVIIHTNDIHGAIQPPGGHAEGGSAALATFVNGWREKLGDTMVLLMDAGDIFQGTPEGNEYRGRLTIDVMNRLRYFAACPGNHEFDFGTENYVTLVRRSNFPWLCENLREIRTGVSPAVLTPAFIIERAGVRYGFFGLITEELGNLTLMDRENGWIALAEETSARDAARRLRDSGADVVIMLSHCGAEHDSALAARLNADTTQPPLIDLIVGGHSHTRLDIPLHVRGTVIVQAGYKGTCVGEVRLLYDRASRRPVIHGRDVTLTHKLYPPDSGMINFLRPYLREIDERMGKPVGRTRAEIVRKLKGAPNWASSPLGNLMCDQMLAATGATFAFQNKGGVRADLPAETVTLRDCFEVSPFGNTVVTMRLKGRDVRELCEMSLAGGLTPLEVGGLIVYFDPDRRAGDRLTNVFVAGKRIEDDREYLVATNNFLAEGGDNYKTFLRGSSRQDTGKGQLELLVGDLARRSEGVAPNQERRWRSINEP